MDKFPEEILLRIFKLLVTDIEQLVILSQVSKRLNRLLEDQKLWYTCFQTRYPIWGSRVQYTFNAKRLIDWKDFVIHLMKQQKSTRNFSFEFVKEKSCTNRKRKIMDGEQDIQLIMEHYMQDKSPFWIQDPLVVDIDPKTKTGVVATGKHRKNMIENRSEHKILFWKYPSWELTRTFELNLSPPRLNCQIIGVQSIAIPSPDGNSIEQVRFFSLAVGVGFVPEIEHENEDRVDIWKSLFIYRLFNDGSTQCVSHIEIADSFLGREIFLFSDTSWSNPDNNVKDWLKIVSPQHATFDNRFTVFILAIGPTYEPIIGCVQLAKFDIRATQHILDPSLTCVYWNSNTNRLYSKSDKFYSNPTEIITTIKLGSEVSCMIHFKYPPYLNHLICTGSYQDDELSVYDWRFGIKVGTLPWKSINSQGDETMIDVRPWGLESTLVLPPYWSENEETDLSQRGFRLIAVGDNRSDNIRDKLEIKVWDISYLLTVNWDPLIHHSHINLNAEDLTHRFPWWSRRTTQLEKYAIHMMATPDQHNHTFHLPYSPPNQFKSMLLSHTFDKDDQDSIIPVKYTAYNVLYTSLFLLTEDGKVTVMDIETGKITGIVENVASGSLQQVRGIDVNVIGGREVVVTSKEGLLRGIVY
ncbi:hypothetical protein EDC94DRAFT_587154 [Helicostylum pulchrum]|uniref:F-box domain-containing protein n=1 Tax=Helicostylum pulchrum TaxID=562976 RepID=A0ABP9XVW1_9FUNG|nr:hypothetical protein EDC94DRAFT_587154 [Helicostylum pulchrum]